MYISHVWLSILQIISILLSFSQQQISVKMHLSDFASRSSLVSLINSNASLIAHILGDIEYFYVVKMTLWAPPSLFAIANIPICRFRIANVRCEQSFSRANGANVQQNIRCVR